MKIYSISDSCVINQLSLDDKVTQQKFAYDLIYEELDRHKIPRSQYSLGVSDGLSDGGVCFHEDNGFWVYYVSERGSRYGLAVFSSISDGMNFLVWMFLASPKNNNGDDGYLPKIDGS